MLLPPCVSIELGATQPAASSAAILVDRCDAILGESRCQLAPTGVELTAPGCWTARVQAPTDAPLTATVVLRDPGHPDRRTVQRSVEFHPRDAPSDRWATLGLLIAALVTIEEHSATPLPDDSAERAARERDAERAAALLKASMPPPAQPKRVTYGVRAAWRRARGGVRGVLEG